MRNENMDYLDIPEAGNDFFKNARANKVETPRLSDAEHNNSLAVSEKKPKPTAKLKVVLQKTPRVDVKKHKSELLTLKNVGAATHRDLILLGIDSIHELAKANPDELYWQLESITEQKQDPCVWDVFAAIIHEAQTGVKQPWWEWTPVRKKRQAAGKF